MTKWVQYRYLDSSWLSQLFFFPGFVVNDIPYLTKDGWLLKWSILLKGSRKLLDFPVWLQFFVKVLFQVINRNGMLS